MGEKENFLTSRNKVTFKNHIEQKKILHCLHFMMAHNDGFSNIDWQFCLRNLPNDKQTIKRFLLDYHLISKTALNLVHANEPIVRRAKSIQQVINEIRYDFYLKHPYCYEDASIQH